MTIIKWDPQGNFAALQERINKLFTDSFPDQLPECTGISPFAWTPPVDIYETERGLIIAADLPGVKRDNLTVEVKGDRISISGERFTDPICPATNYYRRERVCGVFHRDFTLHAGVAPEQITATFKNGVLVLEIPKPETGPTRQICIELE